MTMPGSWSNESGPAIELSIGISPGLLAAGVLLHALACAAILGLLGVGGGALFLPFAMMSFARWLRMAGLRMFGQGLARVRWHEDDSWTLVDSRGRALGARLAPGGYWSERLVLLNWQADDGRRFSAILRPRLQDHEAFRRLRARLRCGESA